MLSYSIFLAFLFSIIRHLQFPIAVVWFNGSSFFTAISIGSIELLPFAIRWNEELIRFLVVEENRKEFRLFPVLQCQNSLSVTTNSTNSVVFSKAL